MHNYPSLHTIRQHARLSAAWTSTVSILGQSHTSMEVVRHLEFGVGVARKCDCPNMDMITLAWFSPQVNLT
jgi:hypothetical protein